MSQTTGSHKATHIVWHSGAVSKADRQARNHHRSFILWFTGLSGSGKSTLAVAVEQQLFNKGQQVYRLDGDNIRHGLNNDLGFSANDRTENIRRIGEVAKLLVDAGVITLTAFISPYRSDRAAVRAMVAADEFIEVFVRCPLEVCEQRDPKGLYAKARTGELTDFTGISAPYEEPDQPDITIDTAQLTIDQGVAEIIRVLQQRSLI